MRARKRARPAHARHPFKALRPCPPPAPPPPPPPPHSSPARLVLAAAALAAGRHTAHAAPGASPGVFNLVNDPLDLSGELNVDYR